MILFHFTYDLFFLFRTLSLRGLHLSAYANLDTVNLISFYFIAGCMCAFSEFFLSGQEFMALYSNICSNYLCKVDTPLRLESSFVWPIMHLGKPLFHVSLFHQKDMQQQFFAFNFVVCIPISTGHIGMGNVVFSLPKKELY